MKKLEVNLKNCYGINSLEHSFDFSKAKLFVIYAPNGSMKTSFAKTFKDLSNGKKSEDLVYTDRQTDRTINGDGEPIKKEEVFVINSYENEYQYSSDVAKLLAREELKRRYQKIHEELESQKQKIVGLLESSAGGVEPSIPDQLSLDVKGTSKNKKEYVFFIALRRLKDEIREMKQEKFSDLKYSVIFNKKTEIVFNNKTFKASRKLYIEKYEEIIKKSKFFKLGLFDHDNAADVAKVLKTNRFLAEELSNRIILKENTEIHSQEELDELIRKEKERVLSGKDVKDSFEKIGNLLNKNPETRRFYELIRKERFILEELDDVDTFKQDFWKAHLYKHKKTYEETVEVFNDKKNELEEIYKEADKDTKAWKRVIEIFKARFSELPFGVTVINREDSTFKGKAPQLVFLYGKETIDEEDLINKVLSQGEKRALYLMKVIFEIEAKKLLDQKTLFIIDDIADSFDYQNKYAIIEYLRDIAEEQKNFYQIILTHNYDFYRTVCNRLIHLEYDDAKHHKLHALKHEDRIELKIDKYQKNPFHHWKKSLDKDECLISLISFVRNITEYSHGKKENKDYQLLTALLHKKKGTNNTKSTDDITVEDMLNVFENVISNVSTERVKDKQRKVKDVIYSVAQSLLNTPEESIELESKVALSIAIRLKAEEFILQHVNDEGIKKSQTYELYERYIELKQNPDEEKAKVFDEEKAKVYYRVILMTPENIHLNSFMYEPILDMSIEKLRDLYRDCCDLHNTPPQA